MRHRVLALVALTAVTASCTEPKATNEAGGSAAAPGEEAKVSPQSTGLPGLLAAMDRDADPCRSFYDYACGGWAKATPLPPDKPRYTRSFSLVSDANELVLRDIFEGAAKNPGSPAREKMGRFYAACMDTAKIDALGRAPIDPLLARLDAVEDRRQLLALVGELHATVWGRVSFDGHSEPPFMHMRLEADYKADPKRIMGQLTQSGLGLPARAMYLPKEGETELADAQVQMLDAYRAHIARMLVVGGMSEKDAGERAAAVLAFETELARNMLTPVQLRDDEANYHKEGFDKIKRRARSAPVAAWFDAAGVPKSKEINLQAPKYFEAMTKQLASADVETLRAYMRFHLVQATSSLLSHEIDDAGFGLVTLVTGVTQQPERWKRCVDATMWALPDLVGPEYVERRFAGESKAIADDMIDRIYAAMEQSLPSLSWMDEKTRTRAVEKIAAVKRKIAYPPKWRDYAEVEIRQDDHFGNAMRERTAAAKREWAKIGKPIDPDEWYMPTPLVNAYYNPTSNEIAFPAGIMQPPFFDASQPNVMNFGGIGAVMGHELTHGFDDSGAKYDKDGFLRSWWEPNVVLEFEKRVACVQDQYTRYEVMPGLHIDGKLTSGENIADIGGVKEAYVAYKAWEAEHGATAPVAEGLTNDQVFFVAWAQNWCTLATEGADRIQVASDPHSPGRFRAEGPLADFPAFWSAFSCSEGTAMHPKDACEVW